MSSEEESGYVHRPGSPDETGRDDREHGEESTAATGGRGDGPDGTGRDEPRPAGFGRSGWVLVGVVVLAVLLVPGVIYLFPAAPGVAGLPFLSTMLVLPLVPAALLGLVAVWSMTAAAGDGPD